MFLKPNQTDVKQLGYYQTAVRALTSETLVWVVFAAKGNMSHIIRFVVLLQQIQNFLGVISNVQIQS